MSHASVIKRGVLLVLILGLVGGGYFISRFATSEGEGTIANRPVPAPQPAPQITKKSLESEYIDAVYPSSYSDPKNLGPGPAELERIQLIEPKMGGYTITVTIKQKGVDVIQADPAFRFRKDNAGEYTARQTNEKVIIMQRNDNSEATAFMDGQDYYAIVSVTTTRPRVEILQEAERFASSMVWR